jgi:hypothetical protein
MGVAGFARQAPSVSYVLAGSFCRYLIDQYGMRTMVGLYGGRSAEDLTGSPLDTLMSRWKQFLRGIPVTAADREAAEVFFRTPPVFDRVCPRVVARWTWEARQALESGDLATASARSWQAFTEAGSYSALALHVRSLYVRQEYALLIERADSVSRRSAHPVQYLPLTLMVGDACWATGNPSRAESLYAHLAEVDLSPSLSEAALLRVMALRDEREGRVLANLFLGVDSSRRAAAASLHTIEPENRVVSYVLARHRTGQSERAEALALLEKIPPGGALFEAMRMRRMGRLLIALGRYNEARSLFWRSLNDDDRPKSRDRVNDWIDRSEWMKAHDS